MTARSSKLALIHVAKKALGLDDDSYRDMIDDLFDVRSAGDLTGKQMNELIDHMKRIGFKPVSKRRKIPAAKVALVAKIRMLWVTLWDLGVVRDSTDGALLAFIRRLTGKQALQWMTGKDAGNVIEALKSWADRDGGVNWAAYATGANPRARIVEAQWQRLGKLSQLQTPTRQGLQSFMATYLSIRETPVEQLDNDQLDSARATLGRWIRKSQKDLA